MRRLGIYPIDISLYLRTRYAKTLARKPRNSSLQSPGHSGLGFLDIHYQICRHIGYPHNYLIGTPRSWHSLRPEI